LSMGCVNIEGWDLDGTSCRTVTTTRSQTARRLR
jgi:hypothetical protein